MTTDWTETGRVESSLGPIMGAAKGVGKGVYERAFGASSRLLSTASRSNKLLDSPPSPTIQEHYALPKYNECFSTPHPEDLPNLSTTTTIPTNPITLEVGPGEGFFECLDELTERKKLLKSWAKLVLTDPDALRHPDCPVVKYDLGPEEVKRKQNSLKFVEKELRSVASVLNVKRKERWSKSDHRVHAKAMDTYAFDCVLGKKGSDPNADSYYAEGYARLICFGLADGIGWGVPSRRAAQAALLGFSTVLKGHLKALRQAGTPWSTVLLAHACQQAVTAGHIFTQALTEAKTTIVGGVVVKLPPGALSPGRASLSESWNAPGSQLGMTADEIAVEPNPWVFVGTSVGDSLIYRYSRSRRVVSEVTPSDRTFGLRDAGGSLGGTENEADLRNFGLHLALVEEGDFIISVSDGVHDNLDPEVLQLNPAVVSRIVEVPLAEEFEYWADVPTNKKNDIKRFYKEHQLAIILNQIPPEELSTKSAVFHILEFIHDTTDDHRKAYEAGSRLQRDWNSLEPAVREETQKSVKKALKHPIGKFDHATCLCVEVGGT